MIWVIIKVMINVTKVMISDHAESCRLAEGRMVFRRLRWLENAAIAPQYLVILSKYNDFDDSSSHQG